MKREEHYIYVIELDKAVLSKKKFREANPDYEEGKPCVYVGMTGKSPEQKFQEHKSGYKSNGFVKQFGTKLKPRQYESLNPMTYVEACKMEVEKARRLRQRGYAVWQH